MASFSKNSGSSRYQQQQKGRNSGNVRVQGQAERRQVGTRETAERAQQRQDGDRIDSLFGYDRFKEGERRLGWLLNYIPVTMPDESGLEKSGMDLYFIDRKSGNFKCTVFFEPYFFIDVSDGKRMIECTQYLSKKFEGCRVTAADKEDLDMPNHLSGKTHKFLKISFGTIRELMDAKTALWPLVKENKKRVSTIDYFAQDFDARSSSLKATLSDPSSLFTDLREYDVPYTMRVSIDLDLRVGAWYIVSPIPYGGSEACTVEWQKDMMELCQPRILAFDIECEKSPLKFPNAENDRIFMISYMVAGQGYLIINRDIVAEDIEDFEYTPKPSFPGPFIAFNEKDEEALLRKFVSHIQELRPHVFVTYNGDRFDWPYVNARCALYPNLSLYNELGIRDTGSSSNGNGSGEGGTGVLSNDAEYTGRCIVHLDAFSWVQRDSYLPQGQQGLKAVTRSKLGYDPIEVDPEDMLRFARERPSYMASYSVSDAVATFYLYTTYVHNFIFSLSTIIPMGPEDVLRKGSGTLCEALLMVEAYRGNIICPNKQVDPLESFHLGRLLESETYIGGHVECLEAGVFRADLDYNFNMVPAAFQQLIDNIDRDLTFTIEVEHGLQRSDVTNYDEVRQAIVEKLEMLRDCPVRREKPIIYHLDVGAMYPNIILTNRLQPSAMVSANDCAACEFNRADSDCKRPMTWTWRGEYSPASHAEFQSVRTQLSYERVGETRSSFNELSEKEQAAMVKARLKVYSQRVYKKTKVTEVQERVNTVCMRENSFYVDTVKAFRDRRYDYKLMTKTWKGKKSAAEKAGDAVARKAAEDKEVLMDSLQLAHKCILNSFYGYVMRKGARWRSMEMAGIVTHTGAALIKQARELVEQVGRPLELDTDGIWCILPASFPQDFKLTTNSSKSIFIGYPCAMLNADVHERYTNHQYQDKVGPKSAKKYASHSECSIFFELDGPYQAMILPASPEEGKLLKKKYVVFNFDGSIAELKGFELKRRGELELVKIFQSQVFEHFLAGSSLEDCYAAVGAVANQWLDVLDERGQSMDDQELLELISERKTISKTLEDYAGRKSTSLTTAARIADFLGDEMVKDKGLNCNLIISRLPAGAPVTERAIPVDIFSCEPSIKRHYLRNWLKDTSLDYEDIREVVDWEYYKERLGKSIQKIITIPAGMQRVVNPCPRVEHPVWLQRIMNEKASGKRQMSLKSAFAVAASRSGLRTGSTAITAMPFLASGNADAARGTTPHQEKSTVPLVSSFSSAKRSIGEANLEEQRQGLQGVEGEDEELELVEHSTLAEASAGIADLEDMGGGSRVGGIAVVHKRRSANSQSSSPSSNPLLLGAASASAPSSSEGTAENGKEKHTESAVQAMSLHKPETEEELLTWLTARKKQWSQLRAAKLAARSGGRGGGLGTAGSVRQYGVPYRPGLGGGAPVILPTAGTFANDLTMDSNGRKRVMGIQDFVRSAALAASHGYWQVIELQETDTPGEFVVWAMTSPTQLQRLSVLIPRTIYVNVRGPEAAHAALQLGGVRVKRDLPHARSGSELYEITIPERKFQRNERALNLFLCDSQVEGVYETQTPLWFRGVLKMGCITRVANHYHISSGSTGSSGGAVIAMVDGRGSGNRKRGSVITAAAAMDGGDGAGNGSSKFFRLQDLEMVSANVHPYLDHTVASFKRIFVYHAMDKNRVNSGLGVLGVFMLDASNVEEWEACKAVVDSMANMHLSESNNYNKNNNDGIAGLKLSKQDKAQAALEQRQQQEQVMNERPLSGKASVWLINSGGIRPPFQRLYRKLQPDEHAASVKFLVSVVSSASEAMRQLGERLSQYGRERHGPTIVVAQGGGFTTRHWRYAVPALQDFPLATMPPNSQDDDFPAIGWQVFTAERMIERFLMFPRWFADRLNCARYSLVPVCNLGIDALTTMMDVVFARQIVHNRHLLWASEGTAPDIGGYERDEYGPWSDVLTEPTINDPGVYRSVCVELDIFGLTVCAILSSGELDAEGLTAMAVSTSSAGAAATGGKGGTDGDIGSYAEASGFGGTGGGGDSGAASSDAACARAFNIFKAIITRCIDDVAHRGDAISDNILTALYRYLCGFGNGLLTDPSLHRVVYGLMTQLFKKLVGGLRRLGTKVVYAEFGRIIIDTCKFEIDAAREYVSFIVDTITAKSTFAFLEISIKHYWTQLAWLGPHNYGGLAPPTVPLDHQYDELEYGEYGGGEVGFGQESDRLLPEAQTGGARTTTSAHSSHTHSTPTLVSGTPKTIVQSRSSAAVTAVASPPTAGNAAPKGKKEAEEEEEAEWDDGTEMAMGLYPEQVGDHMPGEGEGSTGSVSATAAAVAAGAFASSPPDWNMAEGAVVVETETETVIGTETGKGSIVGPAEAVKEKMENSKEKDPSPPAPAAVKGSLRSFGFGQTGTRVRELAAPIRRPPRKGDNELDEEDEEDAAAAMAAGPQNYDFLDEINGTCASSQSSRMLKARKPLPGAGSAAESVTVSMRGAFGKLYGEQKTSSGNSAKGSIRRTDSRGGITRAVRDDDDDEDDDEDEEEQEVHEGGDEGGNEKEGVEHRSGRRYHNSSTSRNSSSYRGRDKDDYGYDNQHDDRDNSDDDYDYDNADGEGLGEGNSGYGRYGGGHDAEGGVVDAPEQGQQLLEGGEAEDDMRAHWNLATHFPPAAAEYFFYIIGEYLQQYRQRREDLCEAREAKLAAQLSGDRDAYSALAQLSRASSSLADPAAHIDTADYTAADVSGSGSRATSGEEGEKMGMKGVDGSLGAEQEEDSGALSSSGADSGALPTSFSTSGVLASDEEAFDSIPTDDDAISAAVCGHMKLLIKHHFTAKMLDIIDELNRAYAFVPSASSAAGNSSSGSSSAAAKNRGSPDSVTAVDAHNAATASKGSKRGSSLHSHHHQHHSHHDASAAFPKRAGSHLVMTSPALEFVKAVTHVLALDPALTDEVHAMRRMLLAQLRVREFDEASKFMEPSLSFVLRDIICAFCSTCRDVDLLRDLSVTGEEEAARWRCPHCQNKINTDEVENRLLDEVDRITVSFLLQDFRSASTHLVSRRLCASATELSEPLLMDVPQQTAFRQLFVLQRVAQYHSFPSLQEAVANLLVQ